MQSGYDPMDTSIESFREEIKKITKKFGLSFQDSSTRPERFSVQFTPNFPMWVNVDIDEREQTATLYMTARAYGVVGDKSDYHDFLSGILASCIRASNTA